MYLMTVLIIGKMETVPRQGNSYDSRASRRKDYYEALKKRCLQKKI